MKYTTCVRAIVNTESTDNWTSADQFQTENLKWKPDFTVDNGFVKLKTVFFFFLTKLL